MNVLRFTKQNAFTCCALLALMLGVSQSVPAQIRIGGITIRKPERRKAPPVQKTDSQTDEAVQPSSVSSPVSDRSATTAEPTEPAPERDEPSLLGFFLSETEKAKGQVDKYDPQEHRYLVSGASREWLLYAVSKRARDAYGKQMDMNGWRQSTPGNRYDLALDALADSAARKLPIYIPDPTLFRVRDPRLERMMLGVLKNTATLKIHKIGLYDAAWQIQKNDYGIPVNRYRSGYIWARDNSDDHSYCHEYSMVIQQDYAGGGRYGASYAKFLFDDLFGCP